VIELVGIVTDERRWAQTGRSELLTDRPREHEPGPQQHRQDGHWDPHCRAGALHTDAPQVELHVRQLAPRSETVMGGMSCDLPGPKTARRLGGEAAQAGSEDAGGGVGGVSSPQAGRRHAHRSLSEPVAVVRLAEDASTLDSVAVRPAAVQVAHINRACVTVAPLAFRRQRRMCRA